MVATDSGCLGFSVRLACLGQVPRAASGVGTDASRPCHVRPGKYAASRIRSCTLRLPSLGSSGLSFGKEAVDRLMPPPTVLECVKEPPAQDWHPRCGLLGRH